MSEKKNYGNRNREKGHEAERLYARIFRDLGHDRCLTSRYASRMHDDAGIDLVCLPFNVQIKAGRQSGMRPEKVIATMKERIAEAFPEGSPERERADILIHHMNAQVGKRRKEVEQMVHLTFADFKKLIEKITWH